MSTQADSQPADYAGLTPDTLLDAIEQCGYLTDGRFLALNSYENRVYQIGIEDNTPIIAKFYRPRRWTTEAITEEHEFSLALLEQEIPVVAPLIINETSLHHFHGYRFALFPRQGGHWPELNTQEHRESSRMDGPVYRTHSHGGCVTKLFTSTDAGHRQLWGQVIPVSARRGIHSLAY
jgi:Ser/Thr protein kinase RdoA (MazF antagonist)